ncbi:preprotein translocase subunit YajC [Campylobacter sp. Cr9]|uniref:preprotein translocase subunit YajC n=1 Tax=unclassified Campylobacter TaxID=2593542 RepID=UPI001EFB0EB5|nr:preprotein translocase subunit YajC [Campylobacter sp. RM5004]MBZ7985416.1 preprotein translocase subunit YajC [Campylobacter sp. Cr9]ULO01012.1 preprotein translocase subunit YajC [Campylobacter sp. RM5004]
MEQNALIQFLPLIVLFAIFYFLIIRPQQKQAKAHKEMLNALTKGDKIVTNGGLIVEVVKAEEDYLKIRINDDVVAKLDKNFVARKYEDKIEKASNNA